jgi:dephospho-CoA kinase
VLGITGAIGAGKSTLCQLLREHGWSVLDTDDVAATALAQVQPFLLRSLPGVLTAEGSLNKALIFAAMLRDADFKQELQQQLRPLVWHHTRTWISGLTGPGALDSALLFESGLDELCDATLCVKCSLAERQKRVMMRKTASARHFDELDAAQWPESAKLARAGLSVSSDGPEEQLEPQLRAALLTLGRPL